MGLFLSLILPLLPVILLLLLTGFAADLILRDCMLPHYALENATAGEAWSQVWARIRAEKREFVVYGLLRVVLPVIAMVLLFLVLIIPGLILAGSLAAVELGLHSAFADASGASAFVGILVQVFSRRTRIWFRCLGRHLPGRAGKHRDSRICADILRRPLPSARRDAPGRIDMGAIAAHVAIPLTVFV